MALVDIISNRKKPVKISNLALDATISVRHKYENKRVDRQDMAYPDLRML